jgi:hypothetical protein
MFTYIDPGTMRFGMGVLLVIYGIYLRAGRSPG